MSIYERIFIGGIILAGLAGILGSPAYASESSGKSAVYEYYDIDGDGYRDRLSVEVDGSGTFMTYMCKNNGKGSYASTELLIALGKAPLNIHLLDFDRDGDIDILLIYPVKDIYHDSGNYLAKNDGKGRFDTIEHLPRDY